MAIHEVIYGDLGEILKTRCVDPQIKLAQERPYTWDDAIIPNYFPSIGIQRPVNLDRIPQYVIDSRAIKPMTESRTLTAISPTCIAATNVRVFISVDETDLKMSSYEFEETYSEEEINRAGLRIGRRGFIFTETEVFKAPEQTHP